MALTATGVVLIVGVVAPLTAIIAIARGDFSGFQASIRGIDGVGESAAILRRTLPLASFSVVLMLAGHGMLTVLLLEAGDGGFSVLAFVLVLLSQAFMVLQGTFHGIVTVWGAEELARTGSVPRLFDPLWRWMYTGVQQVYVYTNLLAVAGYGWAILETGLLPAWIGWGSLGWSGIWLVLFLVLDDNLPLVLFVWPLVTGVVALAV